jgi:hypothetical protein
MSDFTYYLNQLKQARIIRPDIKRQEDLEHSMARYYISGRVPVEVTLNLLMGEYSIFLNDTINNIAKLDELIPTLDDLPQTIDYNSHHWELRENGRAYRLDEEDEEDHYIDYIKYVLEKDRRDNYKSLDSSFYEKYKSEVDGIQAGSQIYRLVSIGTYFKVEDYLIEEIGVSVISDLLNEAVSSMRELSYEYWSKIDQELKDNIESIFRSIHSRHYVLISSKNGEKIWKQEV